MKEMYNVKKEMFFKWMTGVEEDMTNNCLKGDLDLM